MTFLKSVNTAFRSARRAQMHMGIFSRFGKTLLFDSAFITSKIAQVHCGRPTLNKRDACAVMAVSINIFVYRTAGSVLL
jgi:hypothetical protein